MTHAFGLLRQSIEAELTSVKKLSKQDKVNYAVSENEDEVKCMAPLTRTTRCTGMHWAETGLQISCTEQLVVMHHVLKILQIVVPHFCKVFKLLSR